MQCRYARASWDCGQMHVSLLGDTERDGERHVVLAVRGETSDTRSGAKLPNSRQIIIPRIPKRNGSTTGIGTALA